MRCTKVVARDPEHILTSETQVSTVAPATPEPAFSQDDRSGGVGRTEVPSLSLQPSSLRLVFGAEAVRLADAFHLHRDGIHGLL